jgi:hypothetical protein
MVVAVPRIARRRERQVEAGAADGEFMGGQLAHDDGAGLAQFADDDGVGGGDVVDQDLGVAGGRQPGDVDDVLDPDRHAVQRAADAPGGDLGLGVAGHRHGGLAVHPDEGVEPVVQAFDAVEQRGHQLDRRQGPCRKRAGGLRCGEPVQVAHKPIPGFIGGQGSAAGSVG